MSPNALAWMKEHSKCTTLDGIPLENNEAGSVLGDDSTSYIQSKVHFDKTVVGNDIVSLMFALLF